MDTPVEGNANRVEPTLNTGRPVEKQRLSCLFSLDTIAMKYVLDKLVDDPHLVAAFRTHQGVHLIYTIDQLGPSGTGAAPETGIRLRDLQRGLFRSGRGAVLSAIRS